MRNLRQGRLEEILETQKLDAILVTKDENLHYFSGFRGDSAMLLIGKGQRFFITDSRFTEQAASEAIGYEIVQQTNGLYTKLGELVARLGICAIGFEGDNVSYSDYERLRKISHLEKAVSVNLDKLRFVKETEELVLIEEACRIADAAFADICKFLRPGLKEYEVAARLESFMREMGSERAAFSTIVASGVRGSLPHGVASDKEIATGELVTLDFGAVYRGYHSDMTRTVCVGNAADRQREVYDAVLAAQMAAMPEIRPGVSGAVPDAKAREVLKQYGFEEYFGHGLGHGVGLEIHEEPRLSPKSRTENLLENMVVTDEPGVYIPGWGGVRIEDSVRVSPQGGVPLTKSTKDFIEIL